MSPIETAQFYLRPFAESDFAELKSWVENSEAIEFEESSEVFTSKLLQRLINSYEKLGFTKFAIINKENGELVGYCGFELLHNPNNKRNLLEPCAESVNMKKIAGEFYAKSSGDLELGYRLHKKFWGKGQATELAQKVCSWAFENFLISRIIAVTDPENTPSQRVLEKIGFDYVGEVSTKEYGAEKFFILYR